ncbi:hypothetical protein CVT24_007811 [Panaeolus cyanescens]|uniref:Uncharacterized protein n=1 Tax=Panaeolus cyanescens TaxID=181874 RepID=A0A409WZ51_9AGAR|nr:hypothetical protein CVT24_007811 [Panaeolus cyanescens]
MPPRISNPSARPSKTASLQPATAVPATNAATAAPAPTSGRRTRTTVAAAPTSATRTLPPPLPPLNLPVQQTPAPLQPVNNRLPASGQRRPLPRPISAQPVAQIQGQVPPNGASAEASSPPICTAPAPTPPPVASTSLGTSHAPPAVTVLSPEEELEQLRAQIRAQHEELVQLRSAGGAPPPPPPPGGSGATAVNNDNSIPRLRPMPSNLQTAMGLQGNRPLYLGCRRVVRSCINKVEEAYQLNWHDQPDEFVSKVKNLAKAKCPQLGRYRNGWATELLMSTSNKNKRRYDRILERDPDGSQRKSRAIARKARRDAQETEEDDGGNTDDELAASYDIDDNGSSSNSGSGKNGNDDNIGADSGSGTVQDDAGANMEAAQNGIDNASELSEEDDDDMYVDDAPSATAPGGSNVVGDFAAGGGAETEEVEEVEEVIEPAPVSNKKKRQGGNKRK